MRISDWSSDVCSSDLLKTAAGEHIAGVYRQRLNLTSGRIAMIDNGLGFQFVPWSPPLENKLHQHIAGVARDGAGSNGASAGNVSSGCSCYLPVGLVAMKSRKARSGAAICRRLGSIGRAQG